MLVAYQGVGYLPCCSLSSAVARIALVKPEKARNVENMILAAAKRGALQNKVSLSFSAACVSATATIWSVSGLCF